MATKTIILKNTTLSSITIRGKSIPASGQADFTGFQGARQYRLSQDIIDPLLASGDLVVNNGVADLSVDHAEIYLYDELFFSLDDIAPGEVLKRSSVAGVPEAADLTFNDLADANITTPAGTQKLVFDGTNWVNVNDVVSAPDNSEQVVQLQWNPITPISGTASIPVTNVLPLVTEGVEIWSDTLDVQAVGSTVRATTSVTFTASNAASELVFVVFRGSVPVGAALATNANKDKGSIVTFVIYDVPSVTGDTTYSCRVGKNGGPGTWYINILPTPTNPLGGLLSQGAYTIEEIGVVS